MKNEHMLPETQQKKSGVTRRCFLKTVAGATSCRDFFAENSINTPIVNIPRCPPHPDWIVLSVVHLLEKDIPELDDEGRPILFFGENIHDNCPRLEMYKADELSRTLSDPKGCRMDLGCKGPSTYAD